MNDSPRPSPGTPGAGGAFVRRALRTIFSRRGMLALAFILGLGWLLWARCGVRGCPSVDRLVAYQPGGAPVLLDRNGDAFARLAPVERHVVRLDSLPAHLPAAFLVVEDRRFFAHRGIDWIRVGGAALANLRAGHTVQGSSTITMQLARNVFADRIPARERTFRRKLLEARVAGMIERRFSKDEILELYLNHIYFGNGAYGVEAAARHYFGRPAKSVSPAQAALMAALPKAPANYDPRRHPERAKARRDLVLRMLAEAGTLDTEAADRALGQALRIVKPTDPRRAGAPFAPYFVQHVREVLEEQFGEDLWSRPMVVRTTLDPVTQVALEEEIEAELRRVEGGSLGRFTGPRRSVWKAADGPPTYLQGAAAAVQPSTGEVRALVGGRDWVQSRFDRAVDGRRQIGSAFKPFVYATAFGEGWSSWDRIEDSPYRRAARGSPTWEPTNFDGRFLGPVTLREALVLSRNVPTVRLAEAVGVDDIARVAHAAGLTGDMPDSPVLALGVTETSPLEIATAYSVFANGGESTRSRVVTRVETPDGEPIWTPGSGRTRRVLSERVAAEVTELLRDAVDNGTGRAVRTAGYRGPAAGKTGTTNDGADAWFVGYTPDLVASIWVGFDEPRTIAPRASGGTVAAAIWGRALRRIDTGADWPGRLARIDEDEERDRSSRRERDRDRVDQPPRGRDRLRSDRDRIERWLTELERDLAAERRRLERARPEGLRALTRELDEVVDQLPLERGTRDDLRDFLRGLGREIERIDRDRLREQNDALRDWLEEAAHALEDADLPASIRSRIEADLREEATRRMRSGRGGSR